MELDKTTLPGLPPDFLSSVFLVLDTRDLLACTCTCSLWHHLAVSSWHDRVLNRWKLWEPGRWDKLLSEGFWLKIYRDRHQVDEKIDRFLSDMRWPYKREGCIKELQAISLDAVDHLMKSVSKKGPEALGDRYWALYALTQIHVHRAGLEMKRLVDESPNDLRKVEIGALHIAQVHHPESDVFSVTRKLDLLAEELKRRCKEQHATEPKQVLQLLSELLFGPRAPGMTEGNLQTVPSDSSAAADALQSWLPPSGYGLGLQGNMEDFSNPSNSLLDDVLQTRLGLPITLGIIQIAVAQRVGLNVHMLNFPGRVMNRLLIHGDDGGLKEELYFDVFSNGTALSFDEVQERLLQLGVRIERDNFQAMSPEDIFTRMLFNLHSIYRADYKMVERVADIATGLCPNLEYFWSCKWHTKLLLSNYAAALEAMYKDRELVMEGVRREGDKLWEAVQERRFEAEINQCQILVDAHEADCHRQKIWSAESGIRFRIGDVVEVFDSLVPRYGAIINWAYDDSDPYFFPPYGRNESGVQYLLLTDSGPRHPVPSNVLHVTRTAQSHLRRCSNIREVHNDRLGELFDSFSVEPGYGPRYLPNAYMRHRFPQG